VNRRSKQRIRRRYSRRATVLYIVLVVIALLTLAAYQFSEIMITERTASDMYSRRVKARALADSGIEVAAAVLGQRQLITSENVADANLYHNPAMFGGVLMYGSQDAPPRGRGRYSLVVPVENDETATTVRFGLGDESGKLNLNVISNLLGNDEEGQLKAQYALLAIPGMTLELADAILDWVDKDDEEREYGAESAYYEQFGYQAKNGPIESLDELLLVAGVTPRLLYGLDANRNGIIDPDEAAGQVENADIHPLGWSAYLTAHSKEANVKLDGEPKLNVNNGELADLYDQIVDEFAEVSFSANVKAEDIAKFIVAYRMNGPKETEDKDSNENEPASQGVAASDTGDGSSSGRGGGGGGGTVLDQQQVQQMAQGTAKALFSAGKKSEPVTRGGMDLAGGAKVTINSLYDLVDMQVEAEIDGTTTTLNSPWTSENLQNDMPILQERLTTTDKQFIEGRINVNQARKEVLLAAISSVDGFFEEPQLADELVERIINAKLIDSSGAPQTGAIASRATTAWLVTEGLVTVPQMRQLDRFLTTRGDVYRAQVIGYFDEGGPTSRLEVVIDATQRPPRVVFLRDLTDLGKGFTPRQLGSPQD